MRGTYSGWRVGRNWDGDGKSLCQTGSRGFPRHARSRDRPQWTTNEEGTLPRPNLCPGCSCVSIVYIAPMVLRFLENA